MYSEVPNMRITFFILFWELFLPTYIATYTGSHAY